MAANFGNLLNDFPEIKIGKTELENANSVIETEKLLESDEPLLKFASIDDTPKEYLVLNDDNSTKVDESIGGISKEYFIKDDSSVEGMKLKQNSEGFYELTVEAWGSSPSGDLKYANDCMSRIIGNYYPDIELYSDEYNQLMDSLMRINGIQNSDLIYTGDNIILSVPVRDEGNKLIGFIEPTTEEEKNEVKETQKTEEVDFSDSMHSVYLDKNVNLDAIKDTDLYTHLQKNIQWLGGGDTLTEEHFVEFLNHIDGNYNLDGRDGVITLDEVATWFENNKIQNPNSDLFENSNPQEILNILSGALNPAADQNQNYIKLNEVKVNEWRTKNSNSIGEIDLDKLKAALEEIANSGLLELDENTHIDYRLMDLSDDAKEILRHLEANIGYLDFEDDDDLRYLSDGIGDFLSSAHLKLFFETRLGVSQSY